MIVPPAKERAVNPKWLVVVGLFALMPQTASALVVYSSWIHRYAAADLIVAATVVDTQPMSEEAVATYEVTDVIVGKAKIGDKLKVPQYQWHACVAHQMNYAVGEQVFLALDDNRESGGTYWTLEDKRIIDVPGDQKYVVQLSSDNPPVWRSADSYMQLRAAVADLRLSYRFAYSPSQRLGDTVGPPDQHLPCDRIDYVSTEPAPTSFRKRYPPGTKPPIVHYKDRSAVHWRFHAAIQAEQRLMDLYRDQIARRNAQANPL